MTAPTAPAPILPKLIGTRVKRREDPRLIQGRGTYVDDLKVAGMLHMAFKRSDIAHGRITSIDTSVAETMEGVELIMTGAQLAEGKPFAATNDVSPDLSGIAYDEASKTLLLGPPLAITKDNVDQFNY